MKTLAISLFGFLMVATISCGDGHKDNVHNDEIDEVRLYDDGDTLLDYEEVLNRRKSDDQVDSNTFAASLNKDRTALYESLEMTTSDIDRFEKAHTEGLEEMRRHGLENYKLHDMYDLEDESMRTTLSDQQYREYLEMKANNAK